MIIKKKSKLKIIIINAFNFILFIFGLLHRLYGL